MSSSRHIGQVCVSGLCWFALCGSCWLPHTYIRIGRCSPRPICPPQRKVTRYHRTLVNWWKIANTHRDTILLSPQNSGPEKRRLSLFSQYEAYIWTNTIHKHRWADTKQALELKEKTVTVTSLRGKPEDIAILQIETHCILLQPGTFYPSSQRDWE